jgi:hypothetical protein
MRGECRAASLFGRPIFFLFFLRTEDGTSAELCLKTPFITALLRQAGFLPAAKLQVIFHGVLAGFFLMAVETALEVFFLNVMYVSVIYVSCVEWR